VSFSTRRGDASVGRLVGTSLSSLVTPRSRRRAEPRFRRQSSAMTPPSSRRRAEPRFRRQSSAVTPGLATRLNASRAADQQAIMSARRRSAAAPRLRLGGRRRGDRVVGGTVLRTTVIGTNGHGPHASARRSSPRFQPRPLPGSGSRRPAKQPRFGYGRHSVLSFLARRPGGKWLASSRVGTRSGVWLLGRRTGGIR
jgi:hypothetical protein